MSTEKTCTKCGVAKPVGDFQSFVRIGREGPKVYRKGSCRECINAYQRKHCSKMKLEHYRKNKRRYQRNLKNWRISHPEMVLAQHLRQKYRLTLDQYKEMLQRQGGCCAICREPPTEGNCRWGRLAVDHCHTSGRVRGLLCDLCNKGIGSFRDRVELLAAASTYLKGA